MHHDYKQTYTSTFGRGKCSISSPSITISGNWVNDLYIISHTTALTSTVPSMSTKSTSRRRKKKWPGLSSSAHTTVPSKAYSTQPTTCPLHTPSPYAASTTPQFPTDTEFAKPRLKTYKISEFRPWHCCLAHIDPTALWSLIDGYTTDDWMCTACIQAKHKQKIIKVKTQRTTKPFELIHSDVCGLLSTPTATGHHYYIPFLEDYTRCTSV